MVLCALVLQALRLFMGTKRTMSNFDTKKAKGQVVPFNPCTGGGGGY